MPPLGDGVEPVAVALARFWAGALDMWSGGWSASSPTWRSEMPRSSLQWRTVGLVILTVAMTGACADATGPSGEIAAIPIGTPRLDSLRSNTGGRRPVAQAALPGGTSIDVR